MRNIMRRTTIGLAAAALAIGGVAGTSQGAQAAGWDGYFSFTAAEVKEKDRLQKAATRVTCTIFSGASRTLCNLAGAASLNGHVSSAAANGCGLAVKWRSTGSNMSYDRVEYDYTRTCGTGGM